MCFFPGSYGHFILKTILNNLALGEQVYSYGDIVLVGKQTQKNNHDENAMDPNPIL